MRSPARPPVAYFESGTGPSRATIGAPLGAIRGRAADSGLIRKTSPRRPGDCSRGRMRIRDPAAGPRGDLGGGLVAPSGAVLWRRYPPGCWIGFWRFGFHRPGRKNVLELGVGIRVRGAARRVEARTQSIPARRPHPPRVPGEKRRLPRAGDQHADGKRGQRTRVGPEELARRRGIGGAPRTSTRGPDQPRQAGRVQRDRSRGLGMLCGEVLVLRRQPCVRSRPSGPATSKADPVRRLPTRSPNRAVSVMDAARRRPPPPSRRELAPGVRS
jgi:hypothetical protein